MFYQVVCKTKTMEKIISKTAKGMKGILKKTKKRKEHSLLLTMRVIIIISDGLRLVLEKSYLEETETNKHKNKRQVHKGSIEPRFATIRDGLI